MTQYKPPYSCTPEQPVMYEKLSDHQKRHHATQLSVATIPKDKFLNDISHVATDLTSK